MKNLLLAIAFCLTFYHTFSQEDFGIDLENLTPTKNCNKTLDSLNKLPEDVKLILQEEENKIFFGITDKRYLNKIFHSRHIGVSIDIVNRQNYSCNDTILNTQKIIKGELIKPTYKNTLSKNNISYDNTLLISPIGEIPPHLIGKDLEFNLLILDKEHICQYTVFWSLKGKKLDLLDMDLYLDSLSASNIDIDSSISHSHEMTFRKTLFFTIPFEKDKFTYKPEDMQYIIDSLSLTDYEIKRIDIKAFSSVEGSTEHNLELQNKRAESISHAIQSFQNQKFETNTIASENWIAFRKDINKTKYKYLNQKSKEEIKIELQNKSVSDELEPLLAQHRKGMIRILLEKKINYDTSNSTIAIADYNQAMRDKNNIKAKELLDIILANVETKIYSPEIIRDLDIPKSLEFGEQLLKKEFLSTQNTNIPTAELYQKFLELESYTPKNILLQYNLRMLEVKLFSEDESIVNRKTLGNNLQNLSKYKQIDPRLTKRLFVNYHILLGEYYNQEKDYKSKNISLSYIYNNYKKLKMSDMDLLRLSNYFVIYSKKQWAIDIIKDRIKQEDASEELIFQFIDLTVLDPKYNTTSTYSDSLVRASHLNNQRFCNLYQSNKNGGISFQLLDFEVLKNVYCTECPR